MEEKQWLHWRNLSDTSHLRAEMFQPGEEKVVTIREVKKERVTSESGIVSERPVAYFEENILPLVLNVTNCKIISKLYGNGEGNVYDWIGHKIQLYTTTTKVGHGRVPCLRVRDFIPQSNEVEYKCSVCGKTITKAIHDGSIKKYGKAYCSEKCLNQDKNGEDLLNDATPTQE